MSSWILSILVAEGHAPQCPWDSGRRRVSIWVWERNVRTSRYIYFFIIMFKIFPFVYIYFICVSCQLFEGCVFQMGLILHPRDSGRRLETVLVVTAWVGKGGAVGLREWRLRMLLRVLQGAELPPSRDRPAPEVCSAEAEMLWPSQLLESLSLNVHSCKEG